MGFENIPKYDVITPINIPVSPFLYLLGVMLLILLVVVIRVWRRWRGRTDTVVDTRALKYQKLVKINLDDAKSAAYAISDFGYEFAKGELAQTYEDLNKRLELYKYAKSVKSFDHNTIEAYQKFCEKVYEKIS